MWQANRLLVGLLTFALLRFSSAGAAQVEGAGIVLPEHEEGFFTQKGFEGFLPYSEFLLPPLGINDVGTIICQYADMRYHVLCLEFYIMFLYLLKLTV